MLSLRAALRRYPWGSPTFVPELLGLPADGGPVAEAWFGAHATAPSPLDVAGVADLRALIAADPSRHLGDDVVARFGPRLPYLLKVIAAAHPLSLQVHPDRDQARTGFEDEQRRGVPLGAPERLYPDANHKPELIYALTPIEAMVGFRSPRRAAELVAGLDVPLARRLHRVLMAKPGRAGVGEAFRLLLDEATRPSPEEIAEVAGACRQRLADGSPSPRADSTVVRLTEVYPTDAGAVTSLLLNPVTLQPGEALFVPTRTVHAYQSGAGVEIMANSDNVLRAGLTAKRIALPQLLSTVDWVAAPPIRIAPETFHGATRVFYAPVDDFELSVTDLPTGEQVRHPLPGRGPRVLLSLTGHVQVDDEHGGTIDLPAGAAAFASADDGELGVRGAGTLIQAGVP